MGVAGICEKSVPMGHDVGLGRVPRGTQELPHGSRKMCKGQCALGRGHVSAQEVLHIIKEGAKMGWGGYRYCRCARGLGRVPRFFFSSLFLSPFFLSSSQVSVSCWMGERNKGLQDCLGNCHRTL